MIIFMLYNLLISKYLKLDKMTMRPPNLIIIHSWDRNPINHFFHISRLERRKMGNNFLIKVLFDGQKVNCMASINLRENRLSNKAVKVFLSMHFLKQRHKDDFNETVMSRSFHNFLFNFFRSKHVIFEGSVILKFSKEDFYVKEFTFITVETVNVFQYCLLSLFPAVRGRLCRLMFSFNYERVSRVWFNFSVRFIFGCDLIIELPIGSFNVTSHMTFSSW